MDPTLFIQIGSYSMIGISIVSLFTHFVVCPPESEYPQVPTPKQLILRSFVVIFSITWSAIGLVINGQLINKCKDTSKGKMIMAWSIVQCVNGILRYCGVCTKINARRLIHETQAPV
eukprot:UN05310